jgi:hypothetical protein
MKMRKSVHNAVKRVHQEARIAKAYSMPIVNKDLVQNDLNVKKFYESLKK